jgi:hypothetical protein
MHTPTGMPVYLEFIMCVSCIRANFPNLPSCKQCNFLHRSGWKACHLHRISFIDGDSDPFGFVDPAHVIRAAHLIPAFAFGETEDLLCPSKIARRETDGDEDWRFYYVSM